MPTTKFQDVLDDAEYPKSICISLQVGPEDLVDYAKLFCIADITVTSVDMTFCFLE